MRDVALADRPREKLVRHGPAALGDNELLALVIGSGGRSGGALAVANDLLAAQGGLHGLTSSICDDLSRVTGIGRAKAARLLAAVELGRRTLAHAPRVKQQIRTPHEAAAYLMPSFGSRPVEHFGVVLLDTKHRVIRTTVLTIGGLNATIVQPREVFREAIRGGAAALLIFHTHPSGDPAPSPDDIEITRRLVAAGSLMGVDVVDHLILGDVRYCSLKETGQL